MTHIEALEELAAKVEAGDANQNTFLKYGHNLPMLASMWEAYDGSLDAAKALHDAVLPGWECAVHTAGGAWVYIPTRNAPPIKEEKTHLKSPARAWLLAILRALIEQEKAHD